MNFFHHSISVTQFPSLITHHLIFHTRLAPSLTFHHSIFFTLFGGSYNITRCSFFFFPIPKLIKPSKKKERERKNWTQKNPAKKRTQWKKERKKKEKKRKKTKNWTQWRTWRSHWCERKKKKKKRTRTHAPNLVKKKKKRWSKVMALTDNGSLHVVLFTEMPLSYELWK